MNFGGQKASKSAGIGTTVPELLEAFDPDPIRYYLTANAPENADTDFSIDELVRRNNDELVATWGNLVHRTLTFTAALLRRQGARRRHDRPGRRRARSQRPSQTVTAQLEAVALQGHDRAR